MVAQAAPARAGRDRRRDRRPGAWARAAPGSSTRCAPPCAASAGDGVVVLFDLGSAVLALEMALEELADVDRARIAVSDGPLVEGAVRAAVEAAGGAALAAGAARSPTRERADREAAAGLAGSAGSGDRSP